MNEIKSAFCLLTEGKKFKQSNEVTIKQLKMTVTPDFIYYLVYIFVLNIIILIIF